MSSLLSPQAQQIVAKMVELLRQEYRDSFRARFSLEQKLSAMGAELAQLEPGEARLISHIIRPLSAYSTLGSGERGHRLTKAGRELGHLAGIVPPQAAAAQRAQATTQSAAAATTPYPVTAQDAQAATQSAAATTAPYHAATRGAQAATQSAAAAQRAQVANPCPAAAATPYPVATATPLAKTALAPQSSISARQPSGPVAENMLLPHLREEGVPENNSTSVSPREPALSQASRPAPTTAEPLYTLATKISEMKRMPTQNALWMAKMGLQTIADLLSHYPRRWEDKTRITPIGKVVHDAVATVVGVVGERRAKHLRTHLDLVEVDIADATGTITLVWFNQKYMLTAYPQGTRIVASGKVECTAFGSKMQGPDTERAAGPFIHTNRLVPVYRLSGKLVQSTFRRLMFALVPTYAPLLVDPLPLKLRERNDLVAKEQAVVEYHFPSNYDAHEAARRRLAYEELLLLQVRIGLSRIENNSEPRSCFYRNCDVLRQQFLELMPFAPTNAQARVFAEVLGDLNNELSMNRLVQGDVGSGKTMIAAFAVYVAVKNGYQAAIMAPTEILAEQHYRKLSELLGRAGIRVGRLQGSMTRKQKAEAYVLAATQQVDLLIGTHALIQEGLKFANLGLIVIDEQHKFGVMQRTALRQKGENPDLLVMTATPIPRTLSLTLYGDLDVSRIDEMPPGRQPIVSSSLPFSQREQAYKLIREQVAEGRQAYVVCPLIDENDKLEATAAIQEADMLKDQVFPNFSVGLLHGKMKSAEKDAIMEDFRSGKYQLLISTTVIEVGVDVPNATIMVVQDADRFGLAQLHQLRGRIGRGQHASYCIFLGQSESQSAQRKLKAIARLSDGFEVAEEDLEIRGPGDYYGTRQAGMPELKVANLLTDRELLIQAKQDSNVILREDPELKRPQHRLLKTMVSEFKAKANEMIH